MKHLADGLEQLDGFPPNVVNTYLMNGVLVDAGLRSHKGRILEQLKGRGVVGHALTHAHPDHQGSSRAVVDALGVPLWCGAIEADAIEAGDLRPCMPKNPISALARLVGAGPACPVSRRLKEGDEVAGFVVLDVPGHSPGHVAYWRESDRTLVVGDVLTGMNLFTTLRGLHEPPTFFTVDPARNRESIRRVAALEPDLVAFGHGPPWRRSEAKRPFSEEVAKLLG